MNRIRCLIFCFVAAALLFPRAGFAQGAGSGASGADLRKQLFILERSLARSTVNETPKSLSEIVLSNSEVEFPDRINPSGGKDKNSEVKTAGSEKKSPGNVAISLGSGKLSGYSYSTTGLDFTGWSAGDDGAEEGAASVESAAGAAGNKKDSGTGLKLMLRDESINLDSMESDGNMRNSFSGANREWFYGMDNYTNFADLFKEEQETKDYSVTGVGLEFDLGGYQLAILNYSKPPMRKKIVFFGNETEGPYRLKAANIIPGSEIVRIDGTESSRGSGYEIVYSKGEITFATPLDMGRRVVVEYEVAGGGGGEPGKFTGFSLKAGGDEATPADAAVKKGAPARPSGEDAEVSSGAEGEKDRSLFKWGPASVDKWSMTYLSDEVINYGRDGNQVLRSGIEHSLMGMDGAVSLWNNTTVGFEAAKSSGSKNREIGRLVKKEFAIDDTSASDGNPLGPYNLDDDKLPVKEGSEEVRLNGELLVRDEDYTLDLDYGTLRIKNETLNLSSLDLIEVQYRYVPEEDRLSGAEDAKEGLAGLVSLSNNFKGVSHSYSVERRSADFMQVGGQSGNQLNREEQKLAWSGAGGVSLSWSRTLGEALQDYATGVKRTDEGRQFAAEYKGDAFSVSYRFGGSEQYDNKTIRDTDSTKEDRSLNVNYAISEKYQLSFTDTSAEGINLRRGNNSSTYSQARSYSLSAEPIDKLKCSLKFGSGTTGNTSAGASRDSEKSDRSLSLKYDPTKKWSFSYDTSESEVSNSAHSSTGPASATDSAATGNMASKWRLQYKPNDNTTIMYRDEFDQQNQVNGRTEKNRRYYDLRRKIGKNADFQYRKSVMDSNRPGQGQNTDIDNLTLKYKTSWLNGMDISLKHNRQNSQTERLGENATTSDSSSLSNSLGLNCTPFWKDRKFGLEYSMKTSEQASTGQEPGGDNESTLKVDIEIPFIGESFWKVTREQGVRGGRRSTATEKLKIALSGTPVKDVSLQVSYSSDSMSDPQNPQTDRTDSALDIVMKMERHW